MRSTYAKDSLRDAIATTALTTTLHRVSRRITPRRSARTSNPPGSFLVEQGRQIKDDEARRERRRISLQGDSSRRQVRRRVTSSPSAGSESRWKHVTVQPQVRTIRIAEWFAGLALMTQWALEVIGTYGDDVKPSVELLVECMPSAVKLLEARFGIVRMWKRAEAWDAMPFCNILMCGFPCNGPSTANGQRQDALDNAHTIHITRLFH